ncbi:MAG TPA: 4Fe-4S dicluster domain-containing protein [Gemmatimonadaceae bacterium]|jgi:molybdopterin-containing oxidoreductase family iron-sulfur binding subunit
MSDDRETTESAVLDRREFVRLAGASVALAGLAGCTRLPAKNILPYVDNRPELTPGVAQHYATAMTIDGIATGLLVESHDGRPTKVEGNPDHPASLGGSGPLEQASVLQLYDPDRATHARIGSTTADWKALAASLAPSAVRANVGARGAGLRLLIEPTSSPLDEAMLARVLEAHPGARVHMYAPLVPDRAVTPNVAHYDLTAADTILAIDSDFLASGPFHLRYARQFADRRRLATPSDAMNRLYVIEPSFTPTGAAADHRIATRPRDIVPTMRLLLDMLSGVKPADHGSAVGAIARDLATSGSRSVLIVDANASLEMHGLADAINVKLGAMGRTTWSAPSPLIGQQLPIHPFAELVDALTANAVDTLVIVGGNPAYTTPASLRLASLLEKTRSVGYLGLYENETARAAKWFVPMSHYLEAWGDTRAYDGTLSIVQPLVDPLYDSITPAELYGALAGQGTSKAYDLLRASWKTHGISDDVWNAALQRGVVADSAFTAKSSPPAAQTTTIDAAPSTSGVDVVYLADPKIHDGAYANNGWLQELPAPLTKLTWGNAALLSPATAQRLGVTNGEHLSIASDERRLTLPALIVPGYADDTVAVHFGYGRAGAERGASGVGANAYALWPSVGTRFELGVKVSHADGATALAITQTHDSMEIAQPVRTASLAEYRRSPTSVGQRPSRVLSLYPEPAPSPDAHATNQWAMTIDLNTCIGCGACTVACQAENNIPVVGAEEVRRGREMHWIRIDRYFAEREGEVAALLQPMLCQQCEKAPCEYVCPVDATVHSDDGLNDMVYNRCVGTRFCSNNCPYKVRRFNWFDYNKALAETEMMVKNPNVTVRERGVMEKCTFCVQRIREAEIGAERDGRQLRGSEVQTACQQACPTNAIVFGSLTDPDSEMMGRRAQPRAYSALSDLGTEPRVRYLARVRNTNPEMPTGGGR